MKEKEQKIKQYWLTLRISPQQKKRLKRLLAKSTYCQNMSELIKDILFRKEITINTYDASLDDVKEELIGIKKELHSIGININQVTHYFHGHPDPLEKRFYAKKVAHLFKSTETKVNRLFKLISDLGKRWSQR